MIHFCALTYCLKQGEPWVYGISIIEEPGLSNVLALLDNKGYPITAPDGGSVSIHDYRLLPHIFAVSVSMP